jgi:hypothetical protein
VIYLDRTVPLCLGCGRRVWRHRRVVANGAGEHRVSSRWRHGEPYFWARGPFAPPWRYWFDSRHGC